MNTTCSLKHANAVFPNPGSLIVLIEPGFRSRQPPGVTAVPTFCRPFWDPLFPNRTKFECLPVVILQNPGRKEGIPSRLIHSLSVTFQSKKTSYILNVIKITEGID
jgi:hypothetical protein